MYGKIIEDLGNLYFVNKEEGIDLKLPFEECHTSYLIEDKDIVLYTQEDMGEAYPNDLDYNNTLFIDKKNNIVIPIKTISKELNEGISDCAGYNSTLKKYFEEDDLFRNTLKDILLNLNMDLIEEFVKDFKEKFVYDLNKPKEAMKPKNNKLQTLVKEKNGSTYTIIQQTQKLSNLYDSENNLIVERFEGSFQDINDKFIIFVKGHYYYLFDRKNNEIVIPYSNKNTTIKFRDNDKIFIQKAKTKKKGILNFDLDFLIPQEYQDIVELENGFYGCWKGTTLRILDKDFKLFKIIKKVDYMNITKNNYFAFRKFNLMNGIKKQYSYLYYPDTDTEIELEDITEKTFSIKEEEGEYNLIRKDNKTFIYTNRMEIIKVLEDNLYIFCEEFMGRQKDDYKLIHLTKNKSRSTKYLDTTNDLILFDNEFKYEDLIVSAKRKRLLPIDFDTNFYDKEDLIRFVFNCESLKLD